MKLSPEILPDPPEELRDPTEFDLNFSDWLTASKDMRFKLLPLVKPLLDRAMEFATTYSEDPEVLEKQAKMLLLVMKEVALPMPTSNYSQVKMEHVKTQAPKKIEPVLITSDELLRVGQSMIEAQKEEHELRELAAHKT